MRECSFRSFGKQLTKEVLSRHDTSLASGSVVGTYVAPIGMQNLWDSDVLCKIKLLYNLVQMFLEVKSEIGQVKEKIMFRTIRKEMKIDINAARKSFARTAGEVFLQ